MAVAMVESFKYFQQCSMFKSALLMTRMHMESILVPWGTPHMSDRSLET